MTFDTPQNINIVNDDNSLIKRTANVEPVNTCPTTGSALSVNQTNPSSIRDGEDCNIKATVYDTIPTSGEILSGDNPQLVIAPIYGKNENGEFVPLETVETSAGNRLKVDASITSTSTEAVTSVALNDGINTNIKATVYDTIPTSGEILSGDNPQLIVSHNYAVETSGNIVPLEAQYHPDGENGEEYRLKVDSHITKFEAQFNRYRPRLYETTTPISFEESNQIKQAYSFSGDGQIDIIAIKTEDINFSVILEVDGTIIYEIPLSDLQNIFKFVGGDATGINTFTFDTGKGFADVYKTPIDFVSNFTVSIRKLVSPNKNVSGVFIRYRTKI